MSKTKKIFLFVLVSLFFACLSSVLFLNHKTYAETDEALKDFYFSSSDIFIDEDDSPCLKVTLVNTTGLSNLIPNGNNKYYYRLYIYRHNLNGTKTEIACIGKSRYWEGYFNGFHIYDTNNFPLKNEGLDSSCFSFYKNINGELTKTNFMDFGSDNNLFIVFKCDPSLSYSFEFQYYVATGFNFPDYDWSPKIKEYGVDGSICFSSILRSKFSQSLSEDFESFLDDNYSNFSSSLKELCLSLYNDSLEVTVTIVYLEPIPFTPFAFLKSVPNVVLHNYPTGFSKQEISSSLGLDLLKVLSSQYQGYDYNSETGVVRLKYYNSVWLRTKTVDEGDNYVDYFLDLNTNFHNFYLNFVNSGIFNSQAEEYCFNSILNNFETEFTTYEELNNVLITENNLHGYFGGVLIPHNYSLNQYMSDLFNVPTGIAGVHVCYDTVLSLSYSAYTDLLSTYNYGWISSLWDNIWTSSVSGASADFYVFYGDNSATRSIISETGSSDFDNDSGVVVNGLGSILGSLTGMFGSSILSKFFAVLLLIVLILLIIKFYSLIFGKKKSNTTSNDSVNKKPDKPKKKKNKR